MDLMNLDTSLVIFMFLKIIEPLLIHFLVKMSLIGNFNCPQSRQHPHVGNNKWGLHRNSMRFFDNSIMAEKYTFRKLVETTHPESSQY